MKINKEMEGRFCNILMEGIAVQEIKIKKILPDEIIAEYTDKEEVHIDPGYVRASWPDPKRDISAVNARKAASKRKATINAKQRQTEDLTEESTNTQGEED